MTGEAPAINDSLDDGSAPRQEQQSREVQLDNGEHVTVRKTVTGLANTFGGEQIARLTLGGYDGEDDSSESEEPAYPTETFVLIGVHDRSDGDYKRLEGLARRQDHRAGDVVIVHLDPRSGFSAFAFIQAGKIYRLGRGGYKSLRNGETQANIKWYPYDGDGEDNHPDDWTPFHDNRSVSRAHLLITNSDIENTVGIISQTESPTIVSSAGITTFGK